MKAFARYLSAAAVLGALLVFTGCTTTTTARTGASGRTYQIAVVESSKGLAITPQLMTELRDSVAKYLNDEGLTRDGEYVVKVNLTPGVPEDTGQWVVLRINSTPARTYTLLAAYPGVDDYYPYEFHGYYNYSDAGYLPYGYYDPLGYGYGYGYGGGYFPVGPVSPRDRRPGDNNNHPPVARTHWDNNRPDPDHPRSNGPERPRPNDSRTHTDNPRGDGRDRTHDNNTGSSWSGHGNGGGSSYSPPPAHVSPPPPSSPPPPAPASSRSHDNRTEDPTVAR